MTCKPPIDGDPRAYKTKIPAPLHAVIGGSTAYVDYVLSKRVWITKQGHEIPFHALRWGHLENILDSSGIPDRIRIALLQEKIHRLQIANQWREERIADLEVKLETAKRGEK